MQLDAADACYTTFLNPAPATENKPRDDNQVTQTMNRCNVAEATHLVLINLLAENLFVCLNALISGTTCSN